MPDSKNKPRLHVAIFHWALILGPKQEKASQNAPGTKFHIKNTQSRDGSWQYDEQSLEDVREHLNLLARVLIAKVADEKRLVAILRSVRLVQGDGKWNCRSWVVDAVAALEADGNAVGTAVLDWQRIQEGGEKFVAAKVAAGRYERSLDGPRPLYDLLSGREIVP